MFSRFNLFSIFVSENLRFSLGHYSNIICSEDSPCNGAFTGQITDLHIWSRILSPEEIAKYSECQTVDQGGDVLNWNTVDWYMRNLEVHEVDLESLCHQDDSFTKAFGKSRTFEESLNLCTAFGGKLATIKDDKEFDDAATELKAIVRTAFTLEMNFSPAFVTGMCQCFCGLE